MAHGYRALVLRLADYDPARAADIESRCTLSEIAEATVLRAADGPAPPKL